MKSDHPQSGDTLNDPPIKTHHIEAPLHSIPSTTTSTLFGISPTLGPSEVTTVSNLASPLTGPTIVASSVGSLESPSSLSLGGGTVVGKPMTETRGGGSMLNDKTLSLMDQGESNNDFEDAGDELGKLKIDNENEVEAVVAATTCHGHGHADHLKVEGCIFCDIAEAKAGSTRLIWQDEKLVAFHDINPSARYHLLIVPREHIESVRNLTAAHVPLLRSMVKLARHLLENHFNIPCDFSPFLNEVSESTPLSPLTLSPSYIFGYSSSTATTTLKPTSHTDHHDHDHPVAVSAIPTTFPPITTTHTHEDEEFSPNSASPPMADPIHARPRTASAVPMPTSHHGHRRTSSAASTSSNASSTYASTYPHLLGFHVPPFTSVPHLHLHVLVPPFKSWVRAAKYPDDRAFYRSWIGKRWKGLFPGSEEDGGGKGRWVRWWVGVEVVLRGLEEAEKRGDGRAWGWDFL
ncbi:hypothetical protein HDU76_007163 [Blyttiomyces sp. JEL0837]|nr:hypothetical protein HDU76_007163 [Blyttiomyces sp. JEL0837]